MNRASSERANPPFPTPLPRVPLPWLVVRSRPLARDQSHPIRVHYTIRTRGKRPGGLLKNRSFLSRQRSCYPQWIRAPSSRQSWLINSRRYIGRCYALRARWKSNVYPRIYESSLIFEFRLVCPPLPSVSAITFISSECTLNLHEQRT